MLIVNKLQKNFREHFCILCVITFALSHFIRGHGNGKLVELENVIFT